MKELIIWFQTTITQYSRNAEHISREFSTWVPFYKPTYVLPKLMHTFKTGITSKSLQLIWQNLFPIYIMVELKASFTFMDRFSC